MKLWAVIVLLDAVIPNGRARAAETNANPSLEPITISTALIQRLAEEARTNNPGLRAAQSRVKAAEWNAGAVRTWEDPTATVGGEVFSSRGMDPGQMGDLIYGVEEKLPLWGKPKATRHAAGREVSYRRAEAELQFQQLSRDITRDLLATALAERVVSVGEQDLAWLDTTAQSAESRYRAGRAVLADTLQLQNEVAKRADQLRTDRHRLAHERISLNSLLNRDVNSSWPSLQLPEIAPEIPFSEKLVALGLTNEPRLKVLGQEIQQAKAAAELTRKMRWPDVSLGIEGRQFSGDGGFRSGMFVLHVPLPWGNEGKYRQEYLRDREREKAAEQERQDQGLMVREQLHHLTVEIEAQRRQAMLYGNEIIPRSEQALSDRLTDWGTGHGTLRDVLDARRNLLESQLTAGRALTEQWAAVADLLLWTGLGSIEAVTPLLAEPSLTPEHDH